MTTIPRTPSPRRGSLCYNSSPSSIIVPRSAPVGERRSSRTSRLEQLATARASKRTLIRSNLVQPSEVNNRNLKLDRKSFQSSDGILLSDRRKIKMTWKEQTSPTFNRQFARVTKSSNLNDISEVEKRYKAKGTKQLKIDKSGQVCLKDYDAKADVCVTLSQGFRTSPLLSQNLVMNDVPVVMFAKKNLSSFDLKKSGVENNTATDADCFWQTDKEGQVDLNANSQRQIHSGSLVTKARDDTSKCGSQFEKNVELNDYIHKDEKSSNDSSVLSTYENTSRNIAETDETIESNREPQNDLTKWSCGFDVKIFQIELIRQKFEKESDYMRDKYESDLFEKHEEILTMNMQRCNIEDSTGNIGAKALEKTFQQVKFEWLHLRCLIVEYVKAAQDELFEHYNKIIKYTHDKRDVSNRTTLRANISSSIGESNPDLVERGTLHETREQCTQTVPGCVTSLNCINLLSPLLAFDSFMKFHHQFREVRMENCFETRTEKLVLSSHGRVQIENLLKKLAFESE